MSNAMQQKNTYEKLIVDFVDSRNQNGFYLLKMAQVIAEAKEQLSLKTFKKFLKDSRINIKRLQANKMVSVYELSKSDSRLTHFINKEGIEKSFLITAINDQETRFELCEKLLELCFTVKQTKQVVQKITEENKTPAQAIVEVQNKITSFKAKEPKKTVPIEEYEKLKTENEQLKLKLSEFEKKQSEKPVQKIEKVEGQAAFDFSYLN